MKTSLFIIFSLICTAIQSQSNCEFKVNKIDQFKNVRIVETDYNNLYDKFMSKTFAFSLLQNGDDFYLKVKRISVGYESLVVPKGSELLLKTSKDSVFSVFCISNEIADLSNPTGGVKETRINLVYKISQDQLILLREQGLKVFRFVAFDGYEDYEVNQSKWKKFVEKIKCLLWTNNIK